MASWATSAALLKETAILALPSAVAAAAKTRQRFLCSESLIVESATFSRLRILLAHSTDGLIEYLSLDILDELHSIGKSIAVDVFPSSTSAANCFVASVLKPSSSSCTLKIGRAHV